MKSSRKRLLAIVLQGLILALSISGIMVNVLAAAPGYGRLNTFSYYTIQSNLLAAAAMLFSLYYLAVKREEPRKLVEFKSGALLWILVTGIVFALLLADKWHPEGAMVYVNLSLHYGTPIGMVLNWLLFEKKGRFTSRSLLVWMSYPMLYVIFSWVRGAFSGFFPYWFLNPTEPYPNGAGSLGGMLQWVAVLIAGFVILGGVILGLDRWFGRSRG